MGEFEFAVEALQADMEHGHDAVQHGIQTQFSHMVSKPWSIALSPIIFLPGKR